MQLQMLWDRIHLTCLPKSHAKLSQDQHNSAALPGTSQRKENFNQGHVGACEDLGTSFDGLNILKEGKFENGH